MVALSLACAVLVARLVLHRQRPWLATVLLVSAFLLRADVDIIYAHWLPEYVGLCLLLVLLAASRSWRDLRPAVPAIPIAVLVLAVSWSLPSPIPTWSHDFQDPIALLVGNRYAPNPDSELLLSGSFHPSNQLVMSITTDRPKIHPYWRLAVFSQYDGHAWTAPRGDSRTLSPNSALTQLPPEGNDAVSAVVTVKSFAQSLVFPGTPLSVNLGSRPTYPTGSPQPSFVLASRTLSPGSSYHVTGVLAPIGDATSAGGSAEPLAPYLQLPSEPSRVLVLAQQLVSGVFSPTAQVDRLVHFLRDSGHFWYDTSAGSPSDRDAVDDFLFHSRRGYCNQFATTLAVLAREVNLPSRLVSGYVSGQEQGGTFTVRQRDAHSWVEIYLEGQGWVTVDPTPGFDRSAGEAASTGSGAAFTGRRPGYVSATPGQTHRHRKAKRHGTQYRVVPQVQQPALAARHGSFPWLALIIPACLLATAILAQLLLIPRTSTQVYGALAGGASDVGFRIRPHETPLEFAERFRGRDQEYQAARTIVDLYVRERYASVQPSAEELSLMRDAWSILRGRRVFLRPTDLQRLGRRSQV